MINLPFIRALDDLIEQRKTSGSLALPSFEDGMAIFTDYSGENREGSTYVFSFFVFDVTYDHIAFGDAMAELRNTIFKPNCEKEISWKGRNHHTIKKVLPQFLAVVEQTRGFLLTLVFENGVKNAFYGLSDVDLSNELKVIGGDYAPHIARKLLIILHTVSYLISILSRPDRPVTWVTDQDAVVANSDVWKCTLDTFGHVVNQYCPHGLSFLGCSDSKHIPEFKDHLSVPDLAAGVMWDAFRHEDGIVDLAKHNHKLGDQAQLLRSWMANKRNRLVKLNVGLIDGPGGIEARHLYFQPQWWIEGGAPPSS